MTSSTGNGGGAAGEGAVAGGGTDAGAVRVVVYDADNTSEGGLRALLDALGGVRIVEEVSEVGKLVPAVEKYSADLVLANLDVSTEEVLKAVKVAEQQCSGTEFFAVSSVNDANLILTAMRSGFSEFVRLPEESSRLSEAIGALRRRTAEAGATGQIISVIGSAGGVGCTTLAVNLAVELADACGRDVALVDLDFQFGHVAMLLDLEIQHSIADLCGESKTIDERVIQKAAMQHKSGLQVIARPREFEETSNLSAESCTQLLGMLRRMYPYVVLDGPSRSDPTGRCILDMADWNLLIVQPLVTAARNAKRILQALSRYNFNPERIQVVCNRAGGGLSHLNVQRLEKSLGHKIVACIPDDWANVSAAINLGEPLAMNAPKSKAREAIRELSAMIRGAGDGSGEGKSGGLFSRLFGGKGSGAEQSAD